ncbi:MAG: diaminopropionate ammonia-lyase [Elusimicrobia bacterium]|nr:diaminopropionate ammonia-lyase [Elusimicrobiota bacterium]
MCPIKWVENPNPDSAAFGVELGKLMPPGIAEKVRGFHSSIPDFEPTPLKKLSALSRMLGVGGIWVKDEAERLDLSAFKVLGGSYAVYRVLKEKLGIEGEISFDELVSDETRKKLGDMTFAAATDGNHGRGVAWSASRLGQSSVIYVPRETKKFRIVAIEKYGARVEVIDGTYDEAVELIKADSEKNGWQLVSDTAVGDYQEIPLWVMQGYMTMYSEIEETLLEEGVGLPTHVFFQSGVGSFAASALAYWSEKAGDNPPKFVMVEPDKAACFYDSMIKGDGEAYTFPGDLDTIMAGLSCGRPNPIAWELFKNSETVYLSCADYVAARGMRIYAAPLEDDPVVIAGESGAPTLGALTFIMQNPKLAELKDSLGLDENSRILLINTEGDTDPIYYRQIVWEGANAVPEKERMSPENSGFDL